MIRRGGWLRLLLLASLLAWPRLAPGPGQFQSSLRADDGLVAATPRPPSVVRLVAGAPSGAAPYRGAAHPLPPRSALLFRTVAGSSDHDRAAPAGAARRCVGGPRFPTGPPGTLPIA